MNEFGRWLRTTRASRGYGLNQFARKIGCSPSELSRIETGQRRNPNATIVRRIAKALNIPITELYARLGYLDAEIQEGEEPTSLEEFLSRKKVIFDGIALTEEEKEIVLDVLRIIWKNRREKRQEEQ